MNEAIKNHILTRLNEIEKENDVEILYAVESGSRAWGFESTDSDYDVRFIYRHNLEWYLNILPKRDVIEYPVTDLYDYSGWDLRKALFLLNKSNPVLFEWLISPIVYIRNEKVYALLKDASEKYFSPIASIYHYLHMAARNYREYLNAEQVKIKKYFYVLRPLFACMWIDKYNTTPPMEFEKLMYDADMEDQVRDEISGLLVRKRSGVEMGLDMKIQSINSFIESRIDYFEKKSSDYNPKDKPSADYLDNVFIQILKL